MTKTIEQQLRLALTTASVLLSAARIGADIRKHGSHDEHTQACACMVNCVRCIADGLLGH